jgi:hypothetical protein
MKAKIVAAVAALLLACSASTAQAAPISGSFSMSGNFLPLNSWDLFTSLDLATGLDFIALTGSESSPGTAGQFLVNSAKGDFASLVGQTGTIQDLTFAPGLFTPIYAFQSVGALTFDLLSIVPVIQTADFLLLSGTGVLHFGGNDAAAVFKFSGNGDDGTFSFSASEGTTAVPEPASMLLTGSGLAALALIRRRRTSDNTTTS